MSRFRGSVPRRLAADLCFTVGQNSLVVGKNAGNFAESAHFCENPSRKHLRIQSFAGEFPTRERREFFGRAGNWARNRSARSDASSCVKDHLREDKTIIYERR